MQSAHKITAFIILGIFLLSFATADLVFKQSTDVDIKLVCINAGFCSGTSVCNVSVFSPNETVLLSGIQATISPDLSFHNFTVNSSQTSDLGEYRVGGFCKDGSVTNLVDFTFDVTKTGTELTVQRSIIFIILIIGAGLVFMFALWGAIVLPIKNPRNGIGEVIDVGFLKYAKVGLIFFSYTLFVWIINLLLTLSTNFAVVSTQFTGFFTMIFQLLLNFTWPLFMLMIVVFFVMGANDLKLTKLLGRGIRVK